ncbi:ubiquitin-specific protease [Starmerella bacillaris]|uniref:Ubiquitin carboxyl-terminal hydrolase n=1 Tax=Starmerella bacillaris TaxID=1247836 RepID=A0AAV5RLC7_STABA|nr:ubiquitin-specific protease [Starmerella bacillaris]
MSNDSNQSREHLNALLLEAFGLCEEYKDSKEPKPIELLEAAKDILLGQIPKYPAFHESAAEKNEFFVLYSELCDYHQHLHAKALEKRFSKLRETTNVMNKLPYPDNDHKIATGARSSSFRKLPPAPIERMSMPTPSFGQSMPIPIPSKPGRPRSNSEFELNPNVLLTKLQDSKVLLLDVRAHEDFESLHINTKYITCFEPTTLRLNMSIQDLEDTLVIAPVEEGESFANRDNVDLIVMYDKNSLNVADSNALLIVDVALRSGGYKPYLLKGGIDAWRQDPRTKLSISPDNASGRVSMPIPGIPAPKISPVKANQFMPQPLAVTARVTNSPTQAAAPSGANRSMGPELVGRRWTMAPGEKPYLIKPQRKEVPRSLPTSNFGKSYENRNSISSGSPIISSRFTNDASAILENEDIPFLQSQEGYSQNMISSRSPTRSPVHASGPSMPPVPPRTMYPQSSSHHKNAEGNESVVTPSLPSSHTPNLNFHIAHPQSQQIPVHNRPSTQRYSEGYADHPAKFTGLKLGRLLPKKSQGSNNLSPATSAGSPAPVVSSPVHVQHVPTSQISSVMTPKQSPNSYNMNPHAIDIESDKRLVAPSPASINPVLLKSTGLKNLGNSCYMNCVIQSMLSIPQLIAPFADGSYKDFINYNSKLGYKGRFAQEFANLVKAMLQPDTKFIAALGIKNLSGELRPDSFAGYEQQDCQEFLTFMLDSLHEDLNVNGHKAKGQELEPEEEERREQLSIRVAAAIEWERYLTGDTSLIVDLFQGQYLSRLQCLSCHKTSTTYNAFSSLSLPIVGNKLLGGHATLKGCFDEFVKPEILDGDNAWFCPNCKHKRKASKTLRISRLPPVLIIHLKRFKRSKNIGMNKLETPVDYPLRNLDLTKYWPQQKQHEFSQKEANLLSHLPNRGQNPPFIYDLRAVTLHHGSLKGGHYTAIAEKPGMGWFLFDDSIVTPVKEQAAISKNAYVLVYQRRM